MTTAVAVLFALAFAAFLATGANGPDDPVITGASGRPVVEGFGTAEFSVQHPDAIPSTTPFCALVAETPPAHQRGMMGRRDLAGHDAMIFRFDTDQTGDFWNRNVPIALSIAWFDAAGRLVSTSDMAPCGDRDDCPLYPSKAPYRYALEVPQGGLARLGITEGAALAVGGPCPEDAPER